MNEKQRKLSIFSTKRHNVHTCISLLFCNSRNLFIFSLINYIKRSFLFLKHIKPYLKSSFKLRFFKTIKAFSLLELMFALVALSVALAALSPILAKRLDPTVKTTTGTNIKTKECQTLIAPFCTMCFDASECLNCELTQSDCTGTKHLNYQKCKCQ